MAARSQAQTGNQRLFSQRKITRILCSLVFLHLRLSRLCKHSGRKKPGLFNEAQQAPSFWVVLPPHPQSLSRRYNRQKSIPDTCQKSCSTNVNKMTGLGFDFVIVTGVQIDSPTKPIGSSRPLPVSAQYPWLTLPSMTLL